MTQKNGKRDYKHAYELQKKSGETDDQLERQRARRKYDKTGADKNGNGKADSREGKNIDHVKPLRAGGKSTKGNLRLRSPKANMADNGKPARKK